MGPPSVRNSATKPTVLTLVVALLLVLSGCSGFSFLEQEYPPGVTADGVQNATALADAHEQQLREGYRATTVSRAVTGNGTTVFEKESHVRWSSTRANATVDRTRSNVSERFQTDVFVNDSAAFVRITNPSGNVTTQRVTDTSPRVPLPGPDRAWEMVYTMVGSGNTTVTVFDNGTTRIRVRDALMGQGTGNGTLYVTQSGLVTRYRVSYDRTFRGKPVTYHTQVNVTHHGNPQVVKQAWVENVSKSD